MLWLLRHADAADGVPDDARPLTERGIGQAHSAGRALARLGVQLEVCFASPKRRALQTAELACDPLGVEVTPAAELAGGPFDALALTAGYQEAMLVGHDPSISLCLHDLTGAHTRLAKGGLAAINRGELVLLMRPRELNAIANPEEAAV